MVEQYQTHGHFICIDLKSFYASVECVLRDLDPFQTPLVVADKARGDGSVVLAVTPYLKEKGVQSRCRIHDLPKDLDIIYARPSMQTYMDYSTKVINIYLNYVAREDLYIYSIDEAFLDVSSYLKLYQMSDEALAKKILDEIYDTLKIHAVAGVGPNMLISKLAMDIESKKTKHGVAKWSYEDIPNKLWTVKPLSKMWGIGRMMERHLNVLGAQTIGDIAKMPAAFLKSSFGILGLELWFHTHGIDASRIQDQKNLTSNQKSFGVGQVLFKDYDADEIQIIILEMVDDVTRRMRVTNKACQVVHLGIGYSKKYGGGFSRQVKLDVSTQNESIIYQACMELFHIYYDDLPIRKVSISLGNLKTPTHYQYSLFEDAELLEKERKLNGTLDQIKLKYGKNSTNRLSSSYAHATAKVRNKQIGGHHV